MKYGLAVSLLLAAQSTVAFQGSSLFQPPLPTPASRHHSNSGRSIRHLVSTYLSEGTPANNATANTLYLANLVTDAVQTDDDEEEIELAERRRMISERSGTYRVSLPLAQPSRGTKGVEEQPLLMGLCLRQFTTGSSILDQVLDLDSLAIRNVAADVPDMELTPDIANKRIETIDPTLMKGRLEKDASGVYVSSVIFQSPAWNAGVRPGDVMTAAAATFGDALWPKTTLEGVRSALTSRRMVAGKATFEFQRTDVTSKNLDNVYELTLSKPIGLNLRETQDGYVEVVGFTMNAPTLVRRAVRLGDRVVAVDSSLGDQMWPVSTVEGVISACTGRLPGQKVTLRLERPEANLGDDAAQMMVMEPMALPEIQTQQKRQAVDEETQLLKRCRDVLRRYAIEDNIQRSVRATNRAGAKFVDKFAVPAMVADRVVEALAKASATLDSVTLSMTMDAYLSCGKPNDAIRAFEAAVGLNGDGSVLVPAEVAAAEGAEGQIQPNAASALNVYTISSLLKAHAMKKDIKSVRRVVAAMEGRGGEKVSGLETATWPGTGEAGIIVPDTQCYNIAISAAAKTATHDGLQLAMKLFDSLSDSSVIFKTQGYGNPEKNVATYNSIIGALALAGKYDDAFNVFFTMKKVGIKPDKFTYTSLLKACINDGDLQELVYDMQEQGVKTDVVMYNAMIRSMCDEGKLSEARTLITRMEAQGVTPNSKTYGILMKGLLRDSKPGACLALFETACNNKQTSELTENVILYTTAVSAASRLGDHDRALDLVSRMSAVGVKPNMKTLTALIGACLSGDRPDLAAEVYKKVDKPDGYAMLQGLKAFCLSGDLDTATKMLYTQRRGSRTLSGKQLMHGYELLVTTAVKYGDYESARAAVTELMAKSYIPSKVTLRKVVGALGLVEKGQIVMDYDVQRDPQQFEFLLFLIDSMRQRNLALDAYVYAATITCGNQLGGQYREVAELLVKSKAKYDEIGGRVVSLNDDASEGLAEVRWEEALSKEEILKEFQLSPAILPAMDVSVSSRDSRTVFFAEKFMARPRQPKEAEQPRPAMIR
ncbi:Pentatricopeptide repeat-containing protein [Seminavis robusta]|uniref:Pentatricopeptide repeat-containing protein n=1 Tax=Seminavis robusta TaxID=568900 RepID=A0A9N8EYB6_9STRA|nr:Pentatricopeptide repeat-containing protein [Seminavis robusta]|eukprot:Sro2103_g314680.1 Pentatricopeptide repeat-containing protein (1051) ;mRNA; r:5727-8967